MSVPWIERVPPRAKNSIVNVRAMIACAAYAFKGHPGFISPATTPVKYSSISICFFAPVSFIKTVILGGSPKWVTIFLNKVPSFPGQPVITSRVDKKRNTSPGIFRIIASPSIRYLSKTSISIFTFFIRQFQTYKDFACSQRDSISSKVISFKVFPALAASCSI